MSVWYFSQNIHTLRIVWCIYFKSLHHRRLPVIFLKKIYTSGEGKRRANILSPLHAKDFPWYISHKIYTLGWENLPHHSEKGFWLWQSASDVLSQHRYYVLQCVNGYMAPWNTKWNLKFNTHNNMFIGHAKSHILQTSQMTPFLGVQKTAGTNFYEMRKVPL